MNKVNLTSFYQQSYATRERPTTKLGRKYKSHLNQMRKQCMEGFQNEETLKFDDSFCFRENNRQASTSERSRTPASIKCASQILTVKMMGTIQNNFKQVPPSHSSPKMFKRGSEHPVQFDPFNEPHHKEGINQNATSNSTRRKSQTIRVQPSIGFFTENNKSQGILSRKNSCLIDPNNNPPSLLKLQSRQKHYWQLKPPSPSKHSNSRQIVPSCSKKAGYLHYNIIKKDEIRSMTLIQRQEQKELVEKRMKDKNKLYLQTLTQLKIQEGLAMRNAKMKEEIERKRGKKGDSRTSRPQLNQVEEKRKAGGGVKQKNEVRPWDVDLNAVSTPFIDIL